MRDHSPLTIDEFNGLWRRGDADSCPVDHSPDCVNIQFIEGGFETRNGRALYPITAGTGVPNVLKVKNYPKIASESLLLLDNIGNIYDTGSPTPLTPILTIADPEFLDFGLAIFAGRAYISPSTTVHGMDNQFVYVYKGEGTPARKAGGIPPVDADGLLAAANSGTAGNVEAGIHIFAVVYETDTGFLTKIGPDSLPALTAPGNKKVDLSVIPVSPNSYVTKRHLLSTRAIDPALYSGDTRQYQFFYIPEGVIENNTATTLTVNFYDSELLEDASHLLDVLTEIPAGANLTLYRGRLIDSTPAPVAEQSNILVSYPGEPEAFDAVTGIIQLQANDEPITICWELRDVLYIFKYFQTFAVQDNGGDPSSWSVVTLDQGLGCALHGIAISLDTGGTGMDYLICANYSGICLFNGTFQFPPELSYKIADLWGSQNFGDLQRLEMYNDTILKRLYVIMADQQILLIGDYQHGLDPKNMRWVPWTYDVKITSICLTNFNQLIIAATEPTP